MTKQPLYGIDTKQSAQNVQHKVMQEIRKPKQKRKLLLLIPSIVIVAAVLLFLYTQLQPNGQQNLFATSSIRDEITIQISPLTEDDIFLYKNKSTSEQELKNDYKVFFFRYHVTKAKGDVVTIEHPVIWRQFIHEIDGSDRYASGGGWSQNNVQDNFAHDEVRFVFYSKNLTNEQLKTALNSYKLKITLKNKKGEIIEEMIPLGEYVEFVDS